ncbi:MAG: C25 family cysteine peptidase [Planctomycetota bacterium]
MNALHTVAASALLLAGPALAQDSTDSVQRDATVLLITDPSLVEAWQPFADWKTSIGKRTEIVTVAELGKRFEADSVQESIRLGVRHFIENRGTKFVVLGGDATHDGGGLVPGGHRTVHQQERRGIPTDIVYLSPTNWDADGDGVYGEFEDDQEAITYPDGSVGLGRIPVRTADDVAAFTKKVIDYESNYPTDEFATNMVYTCTDSPAYPKVRNSWDSIVSEVWSNGSVERFFSQETPWDGDGEPGSYPLSPDNLVSLINDKRVGKMHIHGHGHLPAWVLETGTFERDHVGALKNQGAYPLITTVSCNTGEYDGRQDPSIVEAVIRAPEAGSVAVVAPVRTGKPHFHSPRDFRAMVQEGKLDGTTWTMSQYWANGLGQNLPTGQALMAAKSAMEEDARKTAGYHLCICEINLLGDPTLWMRGEAPQAAGLLAAEERQSSGDKTRTFHCEATPGTTVTVMGDGVYEVAQVNDEGRAEFELEIDRPKTFRITVSGPSWNVHTTTVKVGEGL